MLLYFRDLDCWLALSIQKELRWRVINSNGQWWRRTSWSSGVNLVLNLGVVDPGKKSSIFPDNFTKNFDFTRNFKKKSIFQAIFKKKSILPGNFKKISILPGNF